MPDQTPDSQHNIRLRNLTLSDYPEAQFCIEDTGRLVAAALTVRIDYRRFVNVHTYDELVESEKEVIHQPYGDALYGLDVFVHPDYRRSVPELVDAKKSIVRLGLVQWQRRPTTSVDDLVQQIEFFVDAISGYRADFCVFPEFFNAPLMGLQDHRTSVDAIRYLSGFNRHASRTDIAPCRLLQREHRCREHAQFGDDRDRGRRPRSTARAS